MTSIKVNEKITEYLKEFDTVDEFNKFYVKHKDELITQTTCALNKKYHITGYRMTKLNGELQLKKIETPKENKFATLIALEVRVQKLEALLMETVNRFNELISQVQC